MNQSSADQHHPSSVDHNKTQQSSTLNRKYVKRPNSKVIQSIAKRRAEDLKRRQAIADRINREKLAAFKKKEANVAAKKVKKVDNDPVAPAPVHPYQKVAKTRAAQKNITKEQASAKELKDQAIKKALRSVATAEQNETKNPVADITAKRKFTAKNIVFALSATVVIVFAIGYFIKINMPNISVQVAAMQAGIEGKYPTYIPKEFSLKETRSETNKITLVFVSNNDQTFELIEEKTFWDSTTLLNNYVKKSWEDYSTIREQGLTIYVSDSNASWVNNGIIYKINATDNILSKQQIRSIATSL